jgi:hypothetical protein
VIKFVICSIVLTVYISYRASRAPLSVRELLDEYYETRYGQYNIGDNSILVFSKGFIFWDITPCSPTKINRHFEGICRLHLQG